MSFNVLNGPFYAIFRNFQVNKKSLPSLNVYAKFIKSAKCQKYSLQNFRQSLTTSKLSRRTLLDESSPKMLERGRIVRKFPGKVSRKSIACVAAEFPLLSQAEIEQASEKAGARRSTPGLSKKLGRSGEGVERKGIACSQ